MLDKKVQEYMLEARKSEVQLMCHTFKTFGKPHLMVSLNALYKKNLEYLRGLEMSLYTFGVILDIAEELEEWEFCIVLRDFMKPIQQQYKNR